MESFQKENVANEFSEFFGNEFLSSDDFNFDSLIDFEVPESSLRFCESGENSEVCVDSDFWADLDRTFFGESEKDGETLDESILFNLNEGQEKSVEESVSAVHMDVDESISENRNAEDNEVVSPIEDSVVQTENIRDSFEDVNQMPRYELRQWSHDIWKEVTHFNIFKIRIVEGVNHHGPGWWADFPLAQQEMLRAQVISEYHSQPSGVFKISERFCHFNEERLLVLVSIFIYIYFY